MSSLAFLVTELQSLASETRRKHPDVREAAEKSLAILRASPEQATASLASDGPQSEDLLRPVFMGCATKNAKVVAISLGSLQRLIALKAVPHSAVPVIINTMSDCMNQGVDIQLRILQTLLSLITNFPAVHGDLLGDALLLCFKLQESRIAVVSSTAAATLRQLVMFVVDKVVDEDRREDTDPNKLSERRLPDGTSISLGPSADDALSVFEDLCLLANSEKPKFLKLDSLRKTFALELIESVLTNYHDLFRKHPEELLLLQHHLCPLLLKALSDRPNFPLTLRATRVVFLLLKQFSLELKTEAEVFLMLLIKIVGSDSDAGTPAQSTDSIHLQANRPQWMRVLAMEIMRGLCNDAELIRNVWDRYDAEEGGSKVFNSLVAALKRLLTEKPALLGVGSQMFGVGVPAQSASSEGYGLDVGGVAGMVANAASATVSSVAGMITTEVGLSVQGSAMKLQCIDQLDKADAPPIPEPYIYLLGVQCLISLCEGFASCTGPLYNTIMVQRPRAAGEPVVRAPPALDMSALSPEDPTTKQLRTVHNMVECGWPALLAALSFIIATNLSEELFLEVLSSYQAMTNVSGMLGLSTPRDAFFTSLAKFAIPTRVVSSLETYTEPATPRTPSTFTENLGLTSPTVAPGLSERNMACLKVLIASALFLAGSLGASWFHILEALQNADYVLTTKGARAPTAKRSNTGPLPNTPSNRTVSLPAPQSAQLNAPTGQRPTTPQPSQSGGGRNPMLADLDSDALQAAIQRLFDASKNMDDKAFHDFVSSLCKLSAAMVGMQSDSSDGLSMQSVDTMDDLSNAMLSPITENAHRRRVSGIHLPRTLRSGDFGISKIGGVATLNIHRLIYRDPEVAWDPISTHLLSVLKHPAAPASIRIQAARVLDDVLTVVPRNISTTGDLQPKVQRRVLDVLSQQIILGSGTVGSSTNTELRKMGLETLHQILQASGHTLVVGWETIFEMLGSVCKPANSVLGETIILSPISPGGAGRGKPPPLGYINDKNYSSLVKIAFQSLTLVCDSLSQLSPEHLRLCISTLGQFGRQADTNIALTAAESLLWGVSDSIQAKRKDVEKEPEYSALWMFLLLEILGLCNDGRPEVRVGAIQTLFRTLQLYGATLSLETWDECIWKITFPLLDSINAVLRQSPAEAASEGAPAVDLQWDESKVLALQSIGSIFHDFLTSKIMRLDSFKKAWEVFVGHIQDSWLFDNRTISAPAVRCLEKAIKASAKAGPDLSAVVTDALEVVWSACNEMGEAVLKRGTKTTPPESPMKPFTQESLMAFVDVIRSTRTVGRQFEDSEWTLERLTRLMSIFKGILTYPDSPDFRPDIDALNPAVVMEAIDGIDLSGDGVPSLILRDLSEYATLAFVAAFDVPSEPSANPSTNRQTRPSGRRVTYIGISKKTMPLLVDLFLKFKDKAAIFVDGTVEAICSAYSIPIKLKYDCPAPSKFGQDQPLWKTATTSFLRIVKECGVQIPSLGSAIPDERVAAIWRQIIDTFRGSILADCTVVDSFPLDVQEAEENFDLALIASLEIDVVPHLGDSRVPDDVVSQLAKVLSQGSRLRDADDLADLSFVSPKSKTSGRLSPDFEKVDFGSEESTLGTTEAGKFLPRERFSYWCFDLLFLICSDVAQDQVASRKRVAALCITSLLNRCRTTLVSYVADESLRGNLPFPRMREEEVVYILRKLLELKIWSGILWAALSEYPSAHCVDQPSIDPTLPPAQLIQDAIKRSTKAHLYHFYPTFCEIVAIPRKTPSAWIMTNVPRSSSRDISASAKPEELRNSVSWTDVKSGVVDEGRAVELDARAIVKECLKEIGREMGVGL
ncbi:hypothetical protein EIP91_003335 [Steccherinum ochraceum]|uniref:Protein MON2 homolog n=1 Tax=Steccherinum ochraceum TaxID=92696 RepID=A0A4R0RRE6_9APHY|nr:hypothetical protein EIP91_003335 [Steccherinum ochraceum]